MVAADRRHAHVGLLRFHHDRELFLFGEAAPVRSTVRGGSPGTEAVKTFRPTVLSSAVSTAAYLRTGTRMKLRSPVNFDLATIDQIAPAAQAGPRDSPLRRNRERHPAPVQRLHMHRPERLDCLRTDVCAHRIAPLLTPSAVLSPLCAALPAQFRQYSACFRAFPASECLIQRPNVLMLCQ